jgi:hypothetical protein
LATMERIFSQGQRLSFWDSAAWQGRDIPTILLKWLPRRTWNQKWNMKRNRKLLRTRAIYRWTTTRNPLPTDRPMFMARKNQKPVLLLKTYLQLRGTRFLTSKGRTRTTMSLRTSNVSLPLVFSLMRDRLQRPPTLLALTRFVRMVKL